MVKGNENREIVIARRLVKRFCNNKGIGPLNLFLKTGKIYSVIGSNGCGKTTLIRCLCKLEQTGSGKLCYTSKESLLEKHLLYSAVFQQPEPWPHLNVLQNITLPLEKVLKLSQNEAKLRAEYELERFGLKDRYKSFAHQLSGGLRQRVVQARTFAMQPTFLYLDEPTSALDPEWTDYFGKLVREYADSGKMVLIVAHQMNFLKKISNQVIYLNNGLILEDGTPDQVFNNPKEPSLIRFIENA